VFANAEAFHLADKPAIRKGETELPEKSPYRKLQRHSLNSPTVSLLGEGPDDRAPYD
jgi:hypothetical protein